MDNLHELMSNQFAHIAKLRKGIRDLPSPEVMRGKLNVDFANVENEEMRRQMQQEANVIIEQYIEMHGFLGGLDGKLEVGEEDITEEGFLGDIAFLEDYARRIGIDITEEFLRNRRILATSNVTDEDIAAGRVPNFTDEDNQEIAKIVDEEINTALEKDAAEIAYFSVEEHPRGLIEALMPQMARMIGELSSKFMTRSFKSNQMVVDALTIMFGERWRRPETWHSMEVDARFIELLGEISGMQSRFTPSMLQFQDPIFAKVMQTAVEAYAPPLEARPQHPHAMTVADIPRALALAGSRLITSGVLLIPHRVVTDKGYIEYASYLPYNRIPDYIREQYHDEIQAASTYNRSAYLVKPKKDNPTVSSSDAGPADFASTSPFKKLAEHLLDIGGTKRKRNEDPTPPPTPKESFVYVAGVVQSILDTLVVVGTLLGANPNKVVSEYYADIQKVAAIINIQDPAEETDDDRQKKKERPLPNGANLHIGFFSVLNPHALDTARLVEVGKIIGLRAVDLMSRGAAMTGRGLYTAGTYAWAGTASAAHFVTLGVADFVKTWVENGGQAISNAATLIGETTLLSGIGAGLPAIMAFASGYAQGASVFGNKIMGSMVGGIFGIAVFLRSAATANNVAGAVTSITTVIDATSRFIRKVMIVGTIVTMALRILVIQRDGLLLGGWQAYHIYMRRILWDIATNDSPYVNANFDPSVEPNPPVGAPHVQTEVEVYPGIAALVNNQPIPPRQHAGHGYQLPLPPAHLPPGIIYRTDAYNAYRAAVHEYITRASTVPPAPGAPEHLANAEHRAQAARTLEDFNNNAQTRLPRNANHRDIETAIFHVRRYFNRVHDLFLIPPAAVGTRDTQIMLFRRFYQLMGDDAVMFREIDEGHRRDVAEIVRDIRQFRTDHAGDQEIWFRLLYGISHRVAFMYFGTDNFPLGGVAISVAGLESPDCSVGEAAYPWVLNSVLAAETLWHWEFYMIVDILSVVMPLYYGLPEDYVIMPGAAGAAGADPQGWIEWAVSIPYNIVATPARILFGNVGPADRVDMYDQLFRVFHREHHPVRHFRALWANHARAMTANIIILVGQPVWFRRRAGANWAFIRGSSQWIYTLFRTGAVNFRSIMSALMYLPVNLLRYLGRKLKAAIRWTGMLGANAREHPFLDMGTFKDAEDDGGYKEVVTVLVQTTLTSIAKTFVGMIIASPWMLAKLAAGGGTFMIKAKALLLTLAGLVSSIGFGPIVAFVAFGIALYIGYKNFGKIATLLGFHRDAVYGAPTPEGDDPLLVAEDDVSIINADDFVSVEMMNNEGTNLIATAPFASMQYIYDDRPSIMTDEMRADLDAHFEGETETTIETYFASANAYTTKQFGAILPANTRSIKRFKKQINDTMNSIVAPGEDELDEGSMIRRQEIERLGKDLGE